MRQAVYKLLLAYEWELLEETGVFLGAPIDFSDGYIHLSTQDQVVGTAGKHFKDMGPLVLAEFDSAEFGDTLIYEPARGSMFPHLYGKLRRAQVKQYWHLQDLGGGEYSFPSQFKAGS